MSLNIRYSSKCCQKSKHLDNYFDTATVKTSGKKIKTIMGKIGTVGTPLIKKNRDLRKTLPNDISDKGGNQSWFREKVMPMPLRQT